MKSVAICAVAAVALAACLPAMAGSVVRPLAKTDSFSWPSQYAPGQDGSVADYWECTDGRPIGSIRWWGGYHPYAEGNRDVNPLPRMQPIAFILRQYADNNGQPGTLIKTVEVPLAKCRQSYAGMVAVEGGFHPHVFSYQATLSAPWRQEEGAIYWLSVQAKYERAPDWNTDGYVHWDWMSTPPAASLAFAGHSFDGATWTPVKIGDPESPVNFAFEIGSLPVGLVPNRTIFGTSGQISVTADVAATDRACYPFVRIIQPSGAPLYFQQNAGFLPSVTPFLGMAAGAVVLPEIKSYPILENAQFQGMPKGTYRLEGGAVDPQTTTSIDDLRYVGVVDSTPLVIE